MSKQTTRREVLRRLAVGAAACPVCASLFGGRDGHADTAGGGHGAGSAHGATKHWDYGGETGPAHWGDLSAEFRVCEFGFEQAPVGLRNAVSAELTGVEPEFRATPLKIVNNGHTIQINCAPGSRSRIEGRYFDLLQFHFHHPSEHLLSGRVFEMELHFVHKSGDGRLAVLGVFIRKGAQNAALAPIWASMPMETGPVQEIGTRIHPAALLPSRSRFFRYQGSLTTPPCSEGVLWAVFEEPIEASEDQTRKFAGLFPVNARPAQPVNRRFLLQSF